MDFLNDVPNEKFDILISNPPYIPEKEIENIMPEVKNYEPRIALTDNGDGLTFYHRIAKKAKTLINPNGFIFLEVGLGEHPQKVLSLFKESKFKIICRPKKHPLNQVVYKVSHLWDLIHPNRALAVTQLGFFFLVIIGLTIIFCLLASKF